MEWLAEHAGPVYFLLGFLAVLAGMAGMMGRRKIWLVVAVALAALIPAAWLLLRNVTTEAKRLEADMESLKKAILARNENAALKHVAHDLKYKNKTREKWYEQLEKELAHYGIDDIRIEKIEVKSVSRADGHASVSFHLDARRENESIYAFDCPGWKFTLEDDVWKLKQVAVRNARLKGTPMPAEE